MTASSAAAHSDGQACNRAREGDFIMRTVAIWTFGLLASMIVGAFIGTKLAGPYDDAYGVWGFLAGGFSHACAFGLRHRDLPVRLSKSICQNRRSYNKHTISEGRSPKR